MRTVRSEVGKTSYGAVLEQFRQTYLLRVGNDTVPISVWRVGGTRYTECRLGRLAAAMVLCTINRYPATIPLHCGIFDVVYTWLYSRCYFPMWLLLLIPFISMLMCGFDSLALSDVRYVDTFRDTLNRGCFKTWAFKVQLSRSSSVKFNFTRDSRVKCTQLKKTTKHNFGL